MRGITPDEVDASRFERRVALARAALAGGTVAEAVTHLREGLALWRGDAMADAPAQGWGAAEVDRLDEVRRCAQEDLWEALLRLGDHAGVVGEIDKLLVSHPGRERSVGLLMLALYRSGRASEAVEAYQRLRGHLVDQLGVEPSALPGTAKTPTAATIAKHLASIRFMAASSTRQLALSLRARRRSHSLKRY